MSRLTRILNPRSIAVIGGGFFGTNVVAQCAKMGFAGEIWPVHPTKAEIAGVRAFASVADLPGVPDAVFVGVNRHATVGIVRELAALGAGGAVCFAAGFLEAGADDAEGAQLQRQLLEAAGDMPVIGPNCYGMINYCDGALLWPDQHGGKRLAPGARGAAIVTQSSNIAINMTMQKRGLPLSFVMTAGNQAQTGISEIALGLIEDERVSCLGLHIEGFDSVAGFERLAARARELEKPIVAMKVGRSEAARAATVSHTASLAGSDAASHAFLKRLGIGRVHSIPAFLETLKLLHAGGPLTGRRLSSMSCSGGEASVMADAAEGCSVHFPALEEGHRARVKATLGPLVAVANPLDYHTFIWGDEKAMTATFAAMVSGGFDLNLLVLDFPRGDRCSDADWWPTVNAFEAALADSDARGAVVASMPENMPEAHAEALMARGLAPLCGIEEALAAAEAAAAVGEAWRNSSSAALGQPPSALPGISPSRGEIGGLGRAALSSTSKIAGDRAASLISPLEGEMSGRTEGGVQSVTVDEAAAKSMLADAGLTVPAGRRCTSADEVSAAAETLGFPVALKALGLAHKSEHGAVRLGLGDAEAVRHAAAELEGLGAGLYVERMVEGGVAELIVGVTRDALFGPVMTVGSGGVFVELLKDSVTLLLPASRKEIEGALRGLKMFPLLDGFRGRPRADLAATIEAIEQIAQFALAHRDEIAEMDINPLIVCAEGQGAWIADALIVGWACPSSPCRDLLPAGGEKEDGRGVGAPLSPPAGRG